MLLAILAGTGPVLADYPIEVIELQAATLEEVIPVVQSLAGADGTVTGMGNSLVIKAAPERVREIRELLTRIDRPPRRLLISVSRAGDDTGAAAGYSGSADIRSGNGRAGINSPDGPVEGSRARLEVRRRGIFRESAVRHQVQVLEGRRVWIDAGSQFPVTRGNPGTARLHAVTGGFYVVPHVSGNDVTLDIFQQDYRAGRKPGNLDTQRSGTEVRGRLGEWIALGDIGMTDDNRRSAPARAQQQRSARPQQIRVRVECIDCGAD